MQEYDPNAGGVGYLTWAEFDRFRNAVDNARQYVPWLRVAGYIKIGADPDEWFNKTSHRVNMPLGLPPAWLAAEEITSLLGEINQWPDLEDVAKKGSEFALLLTREVETAMARWPMSDRAHAVKFFRCQACNQMTLRYYPPRFVGEALIDSVVKCTDKTCRAIVDETMFTRMAVIAEMEEKEKRERVKRLASGKRSAGESEPESGDDLPVDSAGTGEDVASDADPAGVRP